MGFQHAIYDVLYGFVFLLPWEQEILNAPFFQRLRWVKQLGFSYYIFPGAEHTRFSHAIGVMHSMQQMLEALGFRYSEKELSRRKNRSKELELCRILRLAALLHDIGSFPFSHVIEQAYIQIGEKQNRGKTLPNSHEHLGSFIIKNTRFPGGITAILEKYDFDISLLSHIIKGTSALGLANQLMHSDLDADRLDYLLRDAHFTGIPYGRFDRDYILANLVCVGSSWKQSVFAIEEEAVYAVEDFLMSRFSWYSQVIKHPESSKFDLLATSITEKFLEKDIFYHFGDLLDMIRLGDKRFYFWNDLYFMEKLKYFYLHPMQNQSVLLDWVERLLFRKPPKTIHHRLFQQGIFSPHDHPNRSVRVNAIEKVISKLRKGLNDFSGKKGKWILVNIPKKDVTFATSLKKTNTTIKEMKKRKSSHHLFLKERDAIKVKTRDGRLCFLSDWDRSLMKTLSCFFNFVPRAYTSKEALRFFKKKGFL